MLLHTMSAYVLFLIQGQLTSTLTLFFVFVFLSKTGYPFTFVSTGK